MSRIVLEPTNPASTPTALTTEDEESTTVVAEFVEMLGTTAPVRE